jgi:hypothetical protein
MLPSQYLNLDRCEKAFVIASIQIKTENEKKQADKMKKKGKR